MEILYLGIGDKKKEDKIMKNILSNTKMLAALLMAGAAFTACSEKDNIIEEQPAVVKTYKMVVDASIGDDAKTRALYFDGSSLKAKWASTDKVSVFPASSTSTLLGTLTTPGSVDAHTTLSGDLTTPPAVDDNLNLLFPRATWDYTGQKGILSGNDENTIEKKYDYALASVKVTAVSGNAITTDAANFQNQQAIVKFTLKDKATDAAINNASKLTISAASNKLVTKKTLVGIGDKIYHSGYTADDGTGTGGEGYDKLVDGDLETKWCADNGPWFIEFHTASPIQVDGYMLRTGGDTGKDNNWQRNPKEWVLQGKADKNAATWTPIDSKTGNTEMGAYSDKEYDFMATNPGTYQYFRLDITANQGDGGHMQLSEMKLFTTATEATEINAYGPIVVTPSSATSELTVALRNENVGADTYNLTAVVDGIAYTLGQPSVTFENGKYYEITASLTKQTTIDLSAVTTDMTIPDGFTLTGKLDGAHKISIADGATVTLDNVTIEGINSDWFSYAGITCLGDATIILKEGTTNTVNGYRGYYPGIQGAAGKTLTIKGSGTLNAKSYGTGAGIGSGAYSNNDPERACGDIVIEGGTITAVGGSTGGAGIGAGMSSSCGNITIKSTVTHVTATKGYDANSIGAGRDNISCGTVTIETGANVTQN